MNSTLPSEVRGCFIVCDLYDQESIQIVSKYAEIVREKTKDNQYKTHIYLIGNQKDSSNEEEEKGKQNIASLFKLFSLKMILRHLITEIYIVNLTADSMLFANEVIVTYFMASTWIF